MSNTSDNIFNFQVKAQRRCYIAYTLNNEQPVKCTIIGEQPLFFMDYEFADEDDAAFDEVFGIDAIEKGIAELGESIESLAVIEQGEKDTSHNLAHFIGEITDATQSRTHAPTTTIKDITESLRQSRLAAAFIDFAANFGTHLKHSAQVETALYDRGGAILINPHLPRADQILLAARELRRVWQHRNGALLHPLMFHPDQSILVHRAQIADLMAITVRIAWEMQLAGEKDPWERIEYSTMNDLARAFARESYLDFRTLNNGAACGAVFEAWFLSERCPHEDKKLIQQMLADYRGYVFESEEPSEAVTAELIAALGSMPFGKNYLAPFVRTITEDPLFTEVRDRSNANFLWFIKFERSFRETEQELQQTKTVAHADSHRDVSHKNKKDKRIGHNETTSNIITLSFGKDSTATVGERERAGKPFSEK